MTVEPGFGGQKLIPDCLEKVRLLADRKKETGLSFLIEADGGIGGENLSYAASFGLEAAVMGSALFRFAPERRAEEIHKLQAIG